jgi:diguanylate cyclase (GGDEF)-like protein
MEPDNSQKIQCPAPAPKDDLQYGRTQLAKFNEIGKALTSSLDLKEILNIVMDKISELLRPRNWSLLLLDVEKGELRFEIVVGEGSESLKALRLKLGEGVAGWVAREKTPVLIPDVTGDARFSRKGDAASMFTTRSIVCVPMVTRGRCLGVIELVNNVEDGCFGEEDLLVLTTLADYTAIAVENAIFFKKVEELTVTDDLTKLNNARFLHARLDYEMERAKRNKSDLSMIFLDLDYFKDVNDTYGHVRGSALLTEVARLILASIRKTDMACRYGGDEFIVLMPDTPKKSALQVAEKIRGALRDAVLLSGDGLNLRLTGSFGVASFPQDAGDKEGLIHMADNAMYRVKNTTRDAVAEA